MKEIDGVLERIRQVEGKKDKDPLRPSGSFIRKTSEVAFFKGKLKEQDRVELKPSVFVRISLLIFVLGVASLGSFLMPPDNISVIEKPLAFFVLFIFFLSLCARMIFNTVKLKSIIIDTSGIAFDNIWYAWDDIAATAVLTTNTLKQRNVYLVIVMRDEKYYYTFNLRNFFAFNFWGFEVKLSQYIEHFRKQYGRSFAADERRV